MTIVQLEYLIAIANHASFSAAAEKCFVTQPSLSMQIKNLEEELEVVLFDRKQKPLTLTQAGVCVVEQAKEALRNFYQVKEVIASLKGCVSGELRLGVIPTIAPYLLHRFIPAFSTQYPNVQLEVREMITPEILKSLGNDSLDIGILAGRTNAHLEERSLFDDRFFVYLSKNHPLYTLSEIPIERIDPKSLLLLPEGHCLRDQVLDLCRLKQASPGKLRFESGSLETLMRLVDSSACLTIIPEMSLEFISPQHAQSVRPLKAHNASREIILAIRPTFVKKSLIDALQHLILEKCAPQLGNV